MISLDQIWKLQVIYQEKLTTDWNVYILQNIWDIVQVLHPDTFQKSYCLVSH